MCIRLQYQQRSILEGFLEVLVGNWTDSVLFFPDTSLVADVGVGIHHEILNRCSATLSEMGVSQIQHFFL